MVMTFSIGDHVYIRPKNVNGIITAYFMLVRGIVHQRISSPDQAGGQWPVLYEIEYDEPIWHGDILRGHRKDVRRGMHTADTMELLRGG